MRWRGWARGAALLATSGTSWAALPEPAEEGMPEQTLSIDAASTTVNFEIVALWFLKRRGEFTEIEGTLKILDDGKRAQIDVRIAVASVQMKDPEHVELLLSPAFFDAVGHPLIEFNSKPFKLSEKTAVALPGYLTVRGVRRKVRFEIDASHCEPEKRCSVIVNGVLSRSKFGMTEYRRTLSDEVHLSIDASVLIGNGG